jgi:putative copper export protein
MPAALLIVARSVQIAASILLAGIFNFDVVALGPIRGPVSDDLHDVERRLLRVAVWSLVAALLSALLWFWLEVASMSGLSFANAFSGTAWRTVLFETGFGHVWQLRLGLIAAASAPVRLCDPGGVEKPFFAERYASILLRRPANLGGNCLACHPILVHGSTS